MNTKGLLDQLLASGQAMISQNTPPGQREGVPSTGGGLGGMLSSDLTRGALAGGALGLLLGNKKVRKMGGSAVKYGGAAALGALAFRAYSDWQQQNQGAAAHSAPVAMTTSPRTTDRLPAPEQEVHSQAMLRALIAAAKADGHIDDRERGLIQSALARVASDAETSAWLDAELTKPLDPAEVATAATSPEIAAEMYLSSLIAIDQQNFMERSYLDELARQLGLEAGFKAHLERQATAG